MSLSFIESKMNGLIFHPPARNGEILENYPEIQSLQCTNCDNQDIVLSYFIIQPETGHPKTGASKKEKTQLNPPYLLWSHGNACDLPELYPIMKVIHEKLGKRIGIIVYDYEGYGFSSGQCGEQNCYTDLEIMVEHCENVIGISSDRLFLVGHSLGTGVVIDYVSKHDEWSTPIILFSPYKTISKVIIDPHTMDIASHMLLKYIDRFCSIEKIGTIKCPIVIYHGIKDSLIHFSHALDLQQANRKYTSVVLLCNANHNNILGEVNLREIWNIVFNHIKN